MTMTRSGVREVLAVLPTWRASALFVTAWVAVVLLNVVAKTSGALFGALGGYLLAGPVGGVVGLLIGSATHDRELFSLISSLVQDGADRLGRSVMKAAATVADELTETGHPLAGTAVRP
jgi:hypothetical protein